MSLRRAIKHTTGQDVSACHACFDCDLPLANEMDIPLGSLIQMALQNDEEVLQSRTLWSEAVLEASHHACQRGIDLYAVLLALRIESRLRAGQDT